VEPPSRPVEQPAGVPRRRWAGAWSRWCLRVFHAPSRAAATALLLGEGLAARRRARDPGQQAGTGGPTQGLAAAWSRSSPTGRGGSARLVRGTLPATWSPRPATRPGSSCNLLDELADRGFTGAPSRTTTGTCCCASTFSGSGTRAWLADYLEGSSPAGKGRLVLRLGPHQRESRSGRGPRPAKRCRRAKKTIDN